MERTCYLGVRNKEVWHAQINRKKTNIEAQKICRGPAKDLFFFIIAQESLTPIRRQERASELFAGQPCRERGEMRPPTGLEPIGAHCTLNCSTSGLRKVEDGIQANCSCTRL